MSYREHPPPAELAPWLACTWERRADGESLVRVLPDGCIDLVWIEGVGAQIVGANTTAFLVALASGARVAGARLHPGAAPGLLGVAAEALRDARIPVEHLWGTEGERLARTLEEGVDPVGRLRAALIARAGLAGRPDPVVREAVRRLAQTELAVAQLAGDLGLSERQLRRRITVAVGYGPKRLARVLRLGRALEAARGGGDLARVAADAGYADQAHFANDCSALAGVPPSAVLAA